MSPRIEAAIKELEAAIRADSHPWEVRFDLCIFPFSAEFGFRGATRGGGSEEYNLKLQRLNEVTQ